MSTVPQFKHIVVNYRANEASYYYSAELTSNEAFATPQDF